MKSEHFGRAVSETKEALLGWYNEEEDLYFASTPFEPPDVPGRLPYQPTVSCDYVDDSAWGEGFGV